MLVSRRIGGEGGSNYAIPRARSTSVTCWLPRVTHILRRGPSSTFTQRTISNACRGKRRGQAAARRSTAAGARVCPSRRRFLPEPWRVVPMIDDDLRSLLFRSGCLFFLFIGVLLPTVLG